MGQTRPLFCLFSSFSQHNDNIVQILTIKSVDGVLGTRTRGGRMVGADESTELQRHPITYTLRYLSRQFSITYVVISDRKRLYDWSLLYACG